MKILLCLLLATTSVFASDPVFDQRATPHAESLESIHPNLMPGVAGVGEQIGSNVLPCIGCYGSPEGALVLPPPLYVIATFDQPTIIFYFSVETGNVTGPAVVTLQVSEAGTGKVVLSFTNNVSLQANSTNINTWTTTLPNTDGYKGLENVVYTTTIGSFFAQSTTHIWAARSNSDNK